jgi:hypothetical protein
MASFMVMMMKDQVIEMMQCGGLKNYDARVALTSRPRRSCGVAAHHSGFSPEEVPLFKPPISFVKATSTSFVKPQLGHFYIPKECKKAFS